MAQSPAESLPAQTRCIECGREFPLGELMQFREFHACAECKPEVVRKLGAGVPIGRLWRSGRQLVARIENDQVVLPDFCPLCGRPADGDWLAHASSVFTRDSTKGVHNRKLALKYRMCRRHGAANRAARRLRMAFLFAAVASIASLSVFLSPDIVFFAALFFVIGVFIFWGLIRALAVAAIESEFAIIYGCSGGYLEKLREWPESVS